VYKWYDIYLFNKYRLYTILYTPFGAKHATCACVCLWVCDDCNNRRAGYKSTVFYLKKFFFPLTNTPIPPPPLVLFSHSHVPSLNATELCVLCSRKKTGATSIAAGANAVKARESPPPTVQYRGRYNMSDRWSDIILLVAPYFSTRSNLTTIVTVLISIPKSYY